MCCGFSSITLVPEAQTVQPGPSGSPPKVHACLSPGDWVASEHLRNSTMTQDPQPLLFKSHLPGAWPSSCPTLESSHPTGA